MSGARARGRGRGIQFWESGAFVAEQRLAVKDFILVLGPAGQLELSSFARRSTEETQERTVPAIDQVKEHMEVIGADGARVGTVDRVEGKRIKLTKKDSGEGSHKGHHHFIDGSLIADVEGNKVRLSANGDVAVTMEQER